MAKMVKEFVLETVAEPKLGFFEIMIIAVGLFWVLSL